MNAFSFITDLIEPSVNYFRGILISLPLLSINYLYILENRVARNRVKTHMQTNTLSALKAQTLKCRSKLERHHPSLRVPGCTVNFNSAWHDTVTAVTGNVGWDEWKKRRGERRRWGRNGAQAVHRTSADWFSKDLERAQLNDYVRECVCVRISAVQSVLYSRDRNRAQRQHWIKKIQASLVPSLSLPFVATSVKRL